MKTNLRAVTCECGTRIAAGDGVWNGQRFECSSCATKAVFEQAPVIAAAYPTETSEEDRRALAPITTMEELRAADEKLNGPAVKTLGDVLATDNPQAALDAALREEENWSFDSSVCVMVKAEVRYRVLTSSRAGYKNAVAASKRVAIENHRAEFGGHCEAKLAFSKRMTVNEKEAPLWEFHWTVTSVR